MTERRIFIIFLASCWLFFMIRIAQAQTATPPPILGVAWYDVDGDLAYRSNDLPADHVQITVTLNSEVYTLTTDSNGWFGYTVNGDSVDTPTMCPSTFKPWAKFTCPAVGTPRDYFIALTVRHKSFMPIVRN